MITLLYEKNAVLYHKFKFQFDQLNGSGEPAIFEKLVPIQEKLKILSQTSIVKILISHTEFFYGKQNFYIILYNAILHLIFKIQVNWSSSRV